MDPKDRFFTYVAVLFLALIAGIYNLKQRDRATKVLVALLCLTLISELTAHWAAIKYRNNMFVYHFFSPAQLILLVVYFDIIVRSLGRKRLATGIGILAVLAAIINAVFFQSLEMLNSNFLLFEGIVIMGLALYSFQHILTDDRINIYRYGHFWLIAILIFFWSVTYTWWALYSVLQEKKGILLSNLLQVLWAVNIITYSAIGFVLLYFSGKRLANER